MSGQARSQAWCSRCGRELRRGDPRVIRSSAYYCGDCELLAEIPDAEIAQRVPPAKVVQPTLFPVP